MDHFLVDYENIGETGLKGIENLGPDTSTVIFYSEHADKISFDMHQILCRCRSKLEFRKAQTGKKNALDFQLSTYLGYLVASHPGDRFFIISKDNGYRVVMDFWNKSTIQQLDYIGRAYEKPARQTQTPVTEKQTPAPANQTPAPEKQTSLPEKQVPAPAAQASAPAAQPEEVSAAASAEKKSGETSMPEDEGKAVPEKRAYSGQRRKSGRPKEPQTDEFKPSAELMNQLSQLIESEEERENIGRFIVRYKTKQGVNNAIVKLYGTEKAGELYRKIKPLLKDKKGK